MKNLMFIILLIVGLSGCSGSINDEILFSELFDISKIDSIEISNNAGRHKLSPDEQSKFTNDLKNLVLEKGGSFKMGSIGFSLFVENQEIVFSGRTHGEYFETNSESIMSNSDYVDSEWIYFHSGNINIDNY